MLRISKKKKIYLCFFSKIILALIEYSFYSTVFFQSSLKNKYFWALLLTKKTIYMAISCILKRSIVILTFLISSHYTLFGENERKTKSILKALWGNPIESSISFLPLATHTIHSDVFFDCYTACSYKGLEAAVFINTFRNWTAGLLYKRALNLTKRFSINGGGGILYGYKGKLHTINHIPFRNSFLFTGPLSPVLGVGLDYKITKKIAIRIDIAPLVMIYGFRYII